jgi:hypothetical protein
LGEAFEAAYRFGLAASNVATLTENRRVGNSRLLQT